MSLLKVENPEFSIIFLNESKVNTFYENFLGTFCWYLNLLQICEKTFTYKYMMIQYVETTFTLEYMNIFIISTVKC